MSHQSQYRQLFADISNNPTPKLSEDDRKKIYVNKNIQFQKQILKIEKTHNRRQSNVQPYNYLVPTTRESLSRSRPTSNLRQRYQAPTIQPLQLTLNNLNNTQLGDNKQRQILDPEIENFYKTIKLEQLPISDPQNTPKFDPQDFHTPTRKNKNNQIQDNKISLTNRTYNYLLQTQHLFQIDIFKSHNAKYFMSNTRKHTIDMIYKVSKHYKMQENTFFTAVLIFNKFTTYYGQRLGPKKYEMSIIKKQPQKSISDREHIDLLEVCKEKCEFDLSFAMASIFLGYKYDDIQKQYLDFEIIGRAVGIQKFEIERAEGIILDVLQFGIQQAPILSFLNMELKDYHAETSILQEFEELVRCIIKLCQYEENLLKFKFSSIAKTCVQFAHKIYFQNLEDDQISDILCYSIIKLIWKDFLDLNTQDTCYKGLQREYKHIIKKYQLVKLDFSLIQLKSESF